ncbi:ABC transporter ATP-binding protein [Mesorhizobium sp. M1252]|uniref:ABC transporter ATP-binding protein n=1 Tax=Mesorhizobium sp. M1252 TaxID=2957073 RepID=UPI00333A16BB
MSTGSSPTPALLEVSNLSVTLHTARTSVKPVDGVSYRVNEGEVLAIVGESGSGKTILNMAPLSLLPTGLDAEIEGTVKFNGLDILRAPEQQMRKLRGGEIGVIFQDPLSSLNPVRRIGRQIAEVSELHLGMTAAQADKRAAELLALVGLPDPLSRLQQYPHELSGGMRQRVGIAMSIAGEPKLLIADEPTTALDVTVQAQIVELLKHLQRRLQMAIVIITHDFGVVSGMATKVAVMYAGRLSELGPVDDVLMTPVHPYTKGLLGSVPSLNADIGSKFIGLPGQPPDLSRLIRGCAFTPRCASALQSCSATQPHLLSVPGESSTHVAACPVIINKLARVMEDA